MALSIAGIAADNKSQRILVKEVFTSANKHQVHITSAHDELRIIIDSGASISATPNSDDFITPL